MANKAPMKDLDVILPGILGSVLQKDSKDLWAVSGLAAWQVSLLSLWAEDNELKHLKARTHL